jgi:multidrug efflux pump subunit AcrA (membrane-fusion protein)
MFQSIKEKIKNTWNEYKTSKKVWAFFVVLVVIIIIIISKGNNSSVTTTATVERRDVVDAVLLSGRTESASAVELGFADTGRINQVFVTEGDVVSKGQLLASIDTSDLYVNDLEKIIREQESLVTNAYRNLLSSSLQAIPDDITNTALAPIISGVYTGPEGFYKLRIYSSGTDTGKSFELAGLEK